MTGKVDYKSLIDWDQDLLVITVTGKSAVGLI